MNFEAKFQSPVDQLGINSLTYDQITTANETLSFFELLVFCRDFKLIPRLLTKEELKFLWKVIHMERVRQGESGVHYLEFEDFKDFLARLAIFAYNKPGMKMLVLKTKQFLPDAIHMVESLGQYLNLGDENHIRNLILTASHRVSSRYNFRSKGEKNKKLVHELRQDLRGRRMALLLSADPNDEAEQQEALNRASSSGMIPTLSLPSLHEEDVTNVAGGSDENEDLQADKPDKEVISDRMVDMQALKIVAAIRRGILHDTNHAAAVAAANKTNPDSVPSNTSLTSFVPDKQTVDLLTDIAKFGDISDKIIHKKDILENTTNVRKVAGVPGACVSKAQEDALIAYDPSLSSLYDKYSRLHVGNGRIPAQNAKYKESEGPFLDLGQVEQGSIVTFCVHITNTSTRELEIDILTKDFRSDNITVSTIPKAFAPGLSTKVQIRFTIPSGLQNVLGFVEVIGATKNETSSVSICCPVYYQIIRCRDERVAQQLKNTRKYSVDLNAECTIRTLPSLMNKYLGTPPTVEVKFQKTKELWEGTNWREGPRPPAVTESGRPVQSPTRTLWTRKAERADSEEIKVNETFARSMATCGIQVLP